MPLSVRLDSETTAIVERVARRRRTSKSEVVREALSNLEREAVERKADTLYQAIEHLIGCVDTGRGDLSEDTGVKFRALLRERRGGRRSR